VTDALRVTKPACRVTAIGGDEYAEHVRAAALQQAAPVAADALAWLFYTSGRTGRSKGAMLRTGTCSR
jgi:long-subunit acyl-CoA synthetase (AMP-forming)